MLGSTNDLAAALLDHLEDGVWVLDPQDATIIDVNPVAAGRVGHAVGSLVGNCFRDLLDPPLPAEGWRLLMDHTSAGRRHRVPVRLLHVDGAAVAMELTLQRHRSIHHDVVLVVSRDVTDRVTMEHGLRSQRALLHATIEALEEGVAVVDRSGRIESVNDTFCALVGQPAERLVDRSVFDPPWTTTDEFGVVIPAEATVAVRTLRSGIAIRGGVHSVERARGDRSWFRVNAQPLQDGSGGPDGAVIVLCDMTETKRNEAAVRRLMTTDPLTGLWSRLRINEFLESAVRLPGPGPISRVGLLHLDLDNFRTVNDTFGPGVGDNVLVQAADRLRDLGDRGLEIGRVGVDEFLVVLAGDGASLAFDAQLRRLAEEIQRRLQRPFLVDGLEIRLTASVGVARSPGDAQTAVELMAAADRALAAGRLDGRSRLRFYESTLDENTRTGLALDRDLRRAAAQRTLEVHYQPILDLRTGAVAAAEALVRWHHPEQGPIPPSVFIPTAEATGAIGAISDLVLSTVASDIAEWTRDDLMPPQARIAVNISPTEFERARLHRAAVGHAGLGRGVTLAARAGDHREPARAGPAGRRRPAGGAGRHGLPHLPRRLRHRLLVAVVPALVAVPHPQDRPSVRVRAP